MIDISKEPISRIEWVHHSELRANGWNPNIVHEAEMVLLERSILKTGWVQPVLINRTGLVIDGFHRYTLSRVSKALEAKYDGKMPCARLDVDDGRAMVLTVRMNRAKGTHVAILMHELVRKLIDEHGFDPDEVAAEIGALRAEVDLLYRKSVFKEFKLDEWQYSQAWRPAESTIEPKGKDERKPLNKR